MRLINFSIFGSFNEQDNFPAQATQIVLLLLIVSLCVIVSTLLRKRTQGKRTRACVSQQQQQQLGETEKGGDHNNNNNKKVQVAPGVAPGIAPCFSRDIEPVNPVESIEAAMDLQSTEAGVDSQVSAPFMTVPSKTQRRARRARHFGRRSLHVLPVKEQARAHQEQVPESTSMLVIRSVTSSSTSIPALIPRRRPACRRRAWHVSAAAAAALIVANGRKKQTGPLALSKVDLDWFARTGFSTPETFAAAKLEWVARGREWAVTKGKQAANSGSKPTLFPAA